MSADGGGGDGRGADGRRDADGGRDGGDLSSDGPWFGAFGGRFVPETLVPALDELERAYDEARADEAFEDDLDHYSTLYGGRPTPLYHARRLTEHAREEASGDGGPEIHLKREDLVHGGAHKFNNVMGQGLLARYMGKERLIAETGAGQHGVATAMAGAVLGIPAEVYMGAVDAKRQELNVFRMKLLGAEVHVVEAGARTLKDAINEALRDWVTNVETTHYCLGSVVGPHPYPRMVRDFQSVIGEEVRADCRMRLDRLPSALVACVGGGSNAMGTFHPFRDDPDVDLVGVEAGGAGTDTERHAASLVAGSEGVLHGARSFLLQDEDGQVLETHSVSAGLDYPGVGPEHALFKALGRATYVAVDDAAALEATRLLSRLEGIIPALEPAHAVAHAVEMAKGGDYGADDVIVVTLSGRGDKDMGTLMQRLGLHDEAPQGPQGPQAPEEAGKTGKAGEGGA